MIDEDIFNVDETLLDIEWTRQSKLYFEYASRLAEARARVEQLKNEIEIKKTQVDAVYAKIDLDVRSRPERYGLSKTTESSIKNVVVGQDLYTATAEELPPLQKQLLEARFEVDVIQAAVSALDHKKAALENLVKLHGQNYFSTPMAKTEHSHNYLQETSKSRARTRTVERMNKE